MARFTGLLGIIVILAVAWIFSTDKRAIKPRVIFWGLSLQFVFALIVLKTEAGKLFQAASGAVNAMFSYTAAGSTFVFGPLGSQTGPMGVVFAFQVLPIIIFIASFFAILYYFGIMQVLVKGMAVAMQKVMGASGAESLNVAASIFMGQTEAPLTIKPFYRQHDALGAVHYHGQRHGARLRSAVMAAYVKIAACQHSVHLLTAVIMTAPATIMLAKIMIPETERSRNSGNVWNSEEWRRRR